MPSVVIGAASNLTGVPLPASCPDLVSLEVFLSVVRLGSVSRAAAAHGMAQPSASQRVRQLERQLGVQLLARSPAGSVATDAGGLLAEWAEVVVTAAAELVAGMDALRGGTGGRLAVAASMTVAECLLPAWLDGLHRAEPAARVELEVTNSAAVLERVATGRTDLGFIESPGGTAGLSSRVVGRDELVVVVGIGHRWARRRRPVAAAALAATPLVVRERGSGTREALDAAFAAVGLSAVDPALELGSTTAVKAATAAGRDAAVVSRLAVQADVAAGRLSLVSVDGLDLSRRLRAVWRPGPALPALAAALLRRAERSAVGA